MSVANASAQALGQCVGVMLLQEQLNLAASPGAPLVAAPTCLTLSTVLAQLHDALSCSAALEMLVQHRITGLPVLDANKRVVSSSQGCSSSGVSGVSGVSGSDSRTPESRRWRQSWRHVWCPAAVGVAHRQSAQGHSAGPAPAVLGDAHNKHRLALYAHNSNRVTARGITVLPATCVASSHLGPVGCRCPVCVRLQVGVVSDYDLLALDLLVQTYNDKELFPVSVV